MNPAVPEAVEGHQVVPLADHQAAAGHQVVHQVAVAAAAAGPVEEGNNTLNSPTP